ncbi:uncharacterized protein LOC107615660 [Arachis ipaensis]|uniref:uncharacterized protein LOC107615660 n=1 Tax=Arachis ipaensis TaxID=130454 RepID=UPI0007AF8A36|nr:uncharacterized protein LOC107615660 [Arachis ipaensis]
MEKMMKHQELANKNHEASLRNLEKQIGQLSKQAVTERPTNTLPSDTISNPKEECKAIQLRSGRTLVNDKSPAEKETNNKPEENDKLEINIPLTEALEQMPLYAKFIKELINKKKSWNEKETVILTQECSALVQEGIPPKLKDPESFYLPCTIGNTAIDKALCDLCSSINLMPLSMMRRLSIEVKPTQMSLELVDRSLVVSDGVIENLLVRVGKFIFPADFVILDLGEEENDSLIVGRPFLVTTRAIIDVEQRELTLRVNDEKITLNVFQEV